MYIEIILFQWILCISVLYDVAYVLTRVAGMLLVSSGGH